MYVVHVRGTCIMYTYEYECMYTTRFFFILRKSTAGVHVVHVFNVTAVPVHCYMLPVTGTGTGYSSIHVLVEHTASLNR